MVLKFTDVKIALVDHWGLQSQSADAGFDSGTGIALAFFPGTDRVHGDVQKFGKFSLSQLEFGTDTDNTGRIETEFGLLIHNDRILAGGEILLDDLRFSAGVRHVLENVGDCDLEAIWFVTPAQRFINH